jgi:hypothetical protein
MKQFLITEEFRNGLVAYLGDRPYKEVAQAVGLLVGLPEHVDSVLQTVPANS